MLLQLAIVLKSGFVWCHGVRGLLVALYPRHMKVDLFSFPFMELTMIQVFVQNSYVAAKSGCSHDIGFKIGG